MKNVALVAHDGRKSELLEWIKYNHKILEQIWLQMVIM